LDKRLECLEAVVYGRPQRVDSRLSRHLTLPEAPVGQKLGITTNHFSATRSPQFSENVTHIDGDRFNYDDHKRHQ
jgi:hypothetical protein